MEPGQTSEANGISCERWNLGREVRPGCEGMESAARVGIWVGKVRPGCEGMESAARVGIWVGKVRPGCEGMESAARVGIWAEK